MGSADAKERRWRTYPAYKPSGIEWLGAIPEHWEVHRLKYSADLLNQRAEGGDSDLPYTGLEHIDSWTGKRLAPDGESACGGEANVYRGGDVLFGKLRPYLAKVHAADADGVCTGELFVLRPKAVYQQFLFYYLLNRDVVYIVDSSTYGAKMPRANWDFEKKQRQIELLQEKRAAIINHAVTKGLWGMMNDECGMMKKSEEDSSHHSSFITPRFKDSGIEWLGEIPEHWEVYRLKRLGTIRYGLGEPPAEKDDGLPFIRATDIYRGKINAEAIQRVDPDDIPWSRVPELRPRDILVVRSGAYTGDSAIIPEQWGGSIAGYDLVLTIQKAIPEFIGYVLLSRYVLEAQVYLAKMRAAQPHLNAEELGDCILVVPPPQEQSAIAVFLDRETARIDALVERVQESIDLLREYRTALISAAVTGKIDVREEVA